MNRIRRLLDPSMMMARIRHALFRERLVFQARSAISGEIRVVDRGRERTLTINGEAHSIYFTRGGWREAERECWGALSAPAFELPMHPEILMLGLGGGTALRLLEDRIAPRSVTVVELDPEVVSTARKYFFLDDRRNVSVIEADALQAMRELAARERSFDLLIDDVYYGLTSPVDGADGDIFNVMKSLTRPGGTIIFNRPVDHPDDVSSHERFIAGLKRAGYEVAVRTIRRRWWNDVIHCRLPRTR